MNSLNQHLPVCIVQIVQEYVHREFIWYKYFFRKHNVYLVERKCVETRFTYTLLLFYCEILHRNCVKTKERCIVCNEDQIPHAGFRWEFDFSVDSYKDYVCTHCYVTIIDPICRNQRVLDQSCGYYYPKEIMKRRYKRKLNPRRRIKNTNLLKKIKSI